MSLENQVPVVGKSFYSPCKKCETDRYHTVLALPTETSAKLKCEVCGAQSTWKAPKAKAAKTAGPRGAALKAKANAAAARSAAHQAEYESLLKVAEENPTTTYSMKLKFEKDHRVEHPTFGTGVIRTVQPDKIEVVFQDEVRLLVHNRR